MTLVLIKLFEVATRALFTVLVTFALPLEQAGQFGLTATLINLFAFAIGWERHIDLQRQLVGSPDRVFDAGVVSGLKLYAANALFIVPIFLASVLLLARIDILLAAMAALIVVSELLANQLYNITLVQRRYTIVLTTVLIKNGVLLGSIAALVIVLKQALSLDFVILTWFGLSAIGTLVLMAAWWLKTQPHDLSVNLPIDRAVRDQRRASWTHFVIGLFGVLSLQADRFVIGAFLPLTDVGVFFRHILLVSLAYQLFNIGSHNRVLPRVFAAAKTQPVSALIPIVRREWLIVVSLVTTGFLCALGLDHLTDGKYTAQYALEPALGSILLAGVTIRTGADFCAMICNANHWEKEIFHAQIRAFSIGAIVMILLTYLYGMYGTAVGGVVASLLYLAFIARRVAVHSKDPV